MKSNTKKIIGFAGLGAVILIAVIAICLIPNRPQYATAKEIFAGIPAIPNPPAPHAEVRVSDSSADITNSEAYNQLLTFIEGIEVNTKEVKKGPWISKDGAFVLEVAGTNAIILYRADGTKHSIINFTEDFSKIWIETQAIPSYTYNVKDPAEVQKGLAEFLNTGN